MQLIGVAITLTYYAWMHGKFGQTVGKMAGKIRVVNTDLSPISTRTALLRSLYYQGPASTAMLIAAVGMFSELYEVVGVADLIIHPMAGIYVLVSIVMALVDREQQRAIHDRLAATRVILPA